MKYINNLKKKVALVQGTCDSQEFWGQPTWLTKQVPGQLELHDETLSQKSKNRKSKKKARETVKV